MGSTSILIFRKGRSTTNIWFFDVREDGYKKTTSKFGRPPVSTNDLMRLREAWGHMENTPQSFTVEKNTIIENGYKLTPNMYRASPVRSERWMPLGGAAGLCHIIIGKTPSTRNTANWDGPHSWATIADFTSKYIEQTARTITDMALHTVKASLIPADTLLFSFKLSIGKTAISRCDLYTNEAIAALIPKDDSVLVEYLYYILPELDYTKYEQPATKGATLNLRSLSTVLVPVPTVEQQREFIQVMQCRDKEVDDYLSRAAKVTVDVKAFVHDHILGV